jgi:glycosyltransferase involved in cell wall biosynthesis
VKIAILHYSSWPIIGGVESVIRQHAELMVKHGHEVMIICGEGSGFSKRVPTQIVRELNSHESKVQAAQDEIYKGHPGSAYFRLVEGLRAKLEPALKKFDRVIVHNIFTMPFDLAATEVLANFAAGGTRMIAWTHDLAARNPHYKIPSSRTFDLIRERLPNVKYVTISESRGAEFRELTGTNPDRVIENGLEFRETCGVTPEVAELVENDLANSMILLFPTRILERKNILFALQIVAAIRDSGAKVRLLVTGAPDPHNLASVGYFAALKRQAADLKIDQLVTWVNEIFFVDERQMRSLYGVSDAVLFPSRQEGFGLPLLEAAAFRIPIFCSDIEPLRSVAPPGTLLFKLRDAPRTIAARIRTNLEESDLFKGRKHVLTHYSAEQIFVKKIEPFLLEKI